MADTGADEREMMRTFMTVLRVVMSKVPVTHCGGQPNGDAPRFGDATCGHGGATLVRGDRMACLHCGETVNPTCSASRVSESF